MIRHLVAFRFHESVSRSDREALLLELEALPSRFAAMRGWTSGANRSERDDTFEHAFVVDFDAEEELRAYLNSDEHEAFVRERFRPLVAQRAIVSFEC